MSKIILIYFVYLTRTYLILAEPSVVVEKSIAPNEAPIKGLNHKKKTDQEIFNRIISKIN